MRTFLLLLSFVSLIFAQLNSDIGCPLHDSTSCTFVANWSCAMSGNTIHIVWAGIQDLSSMQWGHRKIFYRRSSDGGLTWGPIICLSDDFELYKMALPQIAVWNQDVHVVWDDNQNDGDDCITYKHSPDGGITWEPHFPITLSPDRWRASYASITVWDTHVHVVWHEWDLMKNSTIKYNCSTDGGVTWRIEQVIASENIADQSHPGIKAIGSCVYIAWHALDADSTAFCFRHKYSTNNGTSWVTLSFDKNIETYDGFNPKVYTEDRQFRERNNKKTANSTIYPNPFVSFTKVLGHEKEDFAVYDISGRLLQTYKGKKIGTDLAPGVYLVRGLSQDIPCIRITKVGKVR